MDTRVLINVAKEVQIERLSTAPQTKSKGSVVEDPYPCDIQYHRDGSVSLFITAIGTALIVNETCSLHCLLTWNTLVSCR
jgi:hypothetical protein